MLTEPIPFSRYGTELQRDAILLNDPAENFDAEMLQEHNGQLDLCISKLYQA